MVPSGQMLLEKITATPGISQLDLLIGAIRGERQETQALLFRLEAEGHIRHEGPHGPERKYWINSERS